MDRTALDKELDFFEANRAMLLGKARGEYALIHGDELIGTFVSKEDAINAGYEKFGNTPFLVKLITEVDEVLNFTSNLLACGRR
jgi:hypothetical protein